MTSFPLSKCVTDEKYYGKISLFDFKCVVGEYVSMSIKHVTLQEGDLW